MTFIQKNQFQLLKTNHKQFAWIKVCLEIPLSEDSDSLEIPLSEDSDRPVDTGLKLRVCKTSRCRSRHCRYIPNV